MTTDSGAPRRRPLGAIRTNRLTVNGGGPPAPHRPGRHEAQTPAGTRAGTQADTPADTPAATPGADPDTGYAASTADRRTNA